MSHIIPANDPRNYPLWREALRRKLTVTELAVGLYAVSSFKLRPGGCYEVEVARQGYACPCPATGACTHGALALATESWEIQHEWTRLWFDEHRELVRRILTGQATKNEITRARRAFRKHFPTFPAPEVAEAA